MDVTQAPIQTAPVADPVTETAASFPVAGIDCPGRYTAIPQKREYLPAEDWRESLLEEHCLDREKIDTGYGLKYGYLWRVYPSKDRARYRIDEAFRLFDKPVSMTNVL